MRFICCALALTFAGMPASLMAADPTNEQLRKRFEALKTRVEQLERREKAENKAERKAAAATPAAAAAAAPKTPTKADWGKVMTRMSEAQVRGILGPPVRSRNERNFTIWSWHEPTVRGGEVWLQDGMVERVYPPQL